MYTSLHNIGKKIQKGNIKIYIIAHFKYANLNTQTTLYTAKNKNQQVPTMQHENSVHFPLMKFVINPLLCKNRKLFSVISFTK